MDIRAIVCDVDGTLLTSKQVVDERTVTAIKKARSKGILFGICTGRDADSVRNHIKSWGIEGCIDFVVGSGGSEIDDYILDIYQENHTLSPELIKEIMNHYKDMDCNFTICHEGILYAPKDDDYIRNMAEGDGIEYRASALVTTSFLYEYMNPHVSKSNGLKEALALHDISISQCIAFGDEDNDIDMLEEAGVGVVMGNGSIHAKAVANYVTEDKDSNGIGIFIEKFI